MGGHWSTEEGRQVSTMREIEGQQKEGQKASAVRRKRQAGNTGPKPKNVKTFA